MTDRSLIISLHDVTPAWEAEVRACLTLLDEIGARGVSLLVIPEFRGVAFDREPAFTAWLHERVAAGDEVVLHGWKHIEQVRPRGFVRSLRRAVLTRGEGEFLGLSPEQCGTFVGTGLAALAERDFHPRGFIAPAWLIEPMLYPTLRALGLTYTVRQTGVVPLAGGRKIAAPTLVLRGSSLKMNELSRTVSNLRLPFWRSKPVVRVSIHPIDFRHGADAWYRVVIPALMENRRTVTYGELVEGVAK
jgi:predicted deacetylase